MTTSVVAPPHPLLPPAVNMNRQDGSTSRLVQKRTSVAYKSKQSFQIDAPEWLKMVAPRVYDRWQDRIIAGCRMRRYKSIKASRCPIPNEIPAIRHGVDTGDLAWVSWESEGSSWNAGRFMHRIFIDSPVPSPGVNKVAIRRPACLVIKDAKWRRWYTHAPRRCSFMSQLKSCNHSVLSAIPQWDGAVNTTSKEDIRTAMFLCWGFFGRRLWSRCWMLGLNDWVHETIS